MTTYTAEPGSASRQALDILAISGTATVDDAEAAHVSDKATRA
jgi:hypothetical protein